VLLAVSETFRFLVFPLVVLLCGAALTNLIGPRLSARREDQRKALEVKVGLVEEMSEAVMTLISVSSAADVYRRRIGFVKGATAQFSDQLDRANDANARFDVQAAVIRSKLDAYFAHSALPDAWTRFCIDVGQYYATLGMKETNRLRTLAKLREKYPADMTEDYASTEWGVSAPGQDWWAVQTGLRIQLAHITDTMLNLELRSIKGDHASTSAAGPQ
jgi:hypothetical protein